MPRARVPAPAALPEVTSTEWLTYATAAEHVGVNERTIRRLILDGTLPAFKLGKRAVRIRRSDLDKAFRRIRVYSGDAG